MKILLDECIDWRLVRDLAGHEVSTTGRMGWSAQKNGALLASAAESFDVFVTVDRKLSFQQNLTLLRIAVVVLRANTNRLADLRPLIPEFLRRLPDLKRGTITTIGA
jgi:predicted nuclease of predicted toxin-antitoxin system